MNDVNKFMDFAFKRANKKFADDDGMLEIAIAMIPLMGVSYALAVARGLN